jgi:hypothetical protein
MIDNVPGMSQQNVPAMSQQNTQLITQVVSIAGMLATSFGWLTPTQVAGITTNVLAIVGPLMTLSGIVWSLLASRKNAIVAEAATIPGVKNIQLTNTTAGHELEQVTPANVTVNRN